MVLLRKRTERRAGTSMAGTRVACLVGGTNGEAAPLPLDGDERRRESSKGEWNLVERLSMA